MKTLQAPTIRVAGKEFLKCVEGRNCRSPEIGHYACAALPRPPMRVILAVPTGGDTCHVVEKRICV